MALKLGIALSALIVVAACWVGFYIFVRKAEPVSVPPQVRAVPVPAAKPDNGPPSQPPEQDSSDLQAWFEQLPWVTSLREKLPPGGKLDTAIGPYSEGGWAPVEMRERQNAQADAGQLVGRFRVSRQGRVIEWLDPVAGSYQPLEAYLHQSSPPATKPAPAVAEVTPPPPPAPKENAAPSDTCDFETTPVAASEGTAPHVIADPTNPANHVAEITGPAASVFVVPVKAPDAASTLKVSLRLLRPSTTTLQPLEDGRTPQGLRLRVRLLDDAGHSVMRDTIVHSEAQWQEQELVFYNAPPSVTTLRVEVLWVKGSVYIDDIRLRKAE